MSFLFCLTVKVYFRDKFLIISPGIYEVQVAYKATDSMLFQNIK